MYKLLTWLVLLLGLAGSIAAGYGMKLDIDAREYQQFVAHCQEIKLKITARLDAHEQAVLSGAAIFDASQKLTRHEWHAYVRRLLLNEHFNGIQGLGFAPWIPAKSLVAHQAQIRAEGFPDYKVYPEGEREAYAPIMFIEPFTDRNLRAFGYDMYSEPVRHAAMDRARDENTVTLSGKVILVQETDKDVQAGTLMYAPVYERNKSLMTAALFGWVYSPFRMTDLLNNIVLATQAIHLRVYDGNNTQAEHLLYDNHTDHPDSNSTDSPLVEITSDFNGTTWTLQFEQMRVANGLDYSKAWITLSTGVLISSLLFLLSRSYLMTRINAANIAARLTEKLQESESRFRLLADFAPVLIWLAGTDKLCYHFNKVWLDFTGRTLEQERGNGWAEGVHADDFQRCLDTYVTAFDARLPFKMEYRLRRYDGEYRWILDTGMPRFADDGVFLGYIGSCIDITENKQAETELHASEKRFRSLIKQIPLALGLVRNTGELLYVNDRFKHTFGYTLDDIPTIVQWWTLAYPDEQYRQQVITLWVAALERATRKNTDIEPIEYEVTCKNGEVRVILISGILFEDGVLATFTDITERKQAEAELRIAATVFESQEGMLITDAQEVILKVNRAFTLITGYSAAEVVGQTPRILQSGRYDKAFYAAIWQSVYDTGAWQGEIWNQRKNGEIYPEQLTITAVTGNDNSVTHYVATFVDITERKTTEEYINHLAFYDYLTQLPNRRLLYERIKHGIELNHRTGSQLALLMMDLDKFKAVNDTLGHAAGDELLQQVAKRVKANLREADMVARLGGDEFVILIDDVSHDEHATQVIAESIIHALNQPFTLCQNQEIGIGVSIGIAIYPQHGGSVEALMDNADTALYHAKDQGRGCFAYFSEALTQQARERSALELRLRRAIEQQELHVYFQPQIDINSGRIIGAEALVRWHDPIQGCIMPNQFITLAEETGLIVTIGEWVLRETCRLGQQWLAEGLPAITLAVNISPYQFRRCDMNRIVMQALGDTGFPACHLGLEITEIGLMENKDLAMSILKGLNEQGVHLIIDNFGSGYSSLAYLKYLPIDSLKIDKTFINDIPSSQNDIAITAAIIAMAHHLGFKVLAEGVETQEQVLFLQQQGCDRYQGYLYSKAVSADDFAKLLVKPLRKKIANVGVG